ncbi:CAP domain-containing protein [Strongyloides ratti]|nr:CAP domain-containing protein [Strongyloides ratti]CEF66055.1 CAP domain-containing protein [Strongyloides ratti]
MRSLVKSGKFTVNSFIENNIFLGDKSNSLLTIQVTPVTFYSCGIYVFMSYMSAKKYCELLKTSKNLLPLDAFEGSLTLTTELKRDTIGLRSLDFNLLLTAGELSKHIWTKIWKGYKKTDEYLANKFSDFIRRMVKEINTRRYYHNARPLQYNLKLEVEAQKCSKLLALRKTLFLDYNRTFGETIGRFDYRLAPLVVKYWYDRHVFFQNGKNIYPEVIMFTQLVWKSSKQIGCSVTKNGLILYICCKFYPAGNIEGKFDDNIGLNLHSFAKKTYLFK